MEQLKSEPDVIIIGGGPAGLSAALWCIDLGLNAMLLEKESDPGGQLLWTFNPIENFLGFESVDARELKEKFVRHLDARRVPLLTNSSVTAVDMKSKVVTLADERRFSAKALILATGVRRRRLGIPGEIEFEGRGILHSGVSSRSSVGGKSVVIVGGGDAAIENALLLCSTARSVTVIHRRKEFAARKAFLDEATHKGNIEFMVETEPLAVRGDDTVTGVEVENGKNGIRTIVPAEAVLIRIGVMPNTELFRGQLEMDPQRYILVDHNCATTSPGTFAVGDAAHPLSPTISTAIGSGATAAKAARALISAHDNM